MIDPSGDDSRKAFEKCEMQDRHLRSLQIDRKASGEYWNGIVEYGWQRWQAAVQFANEQASKPLSKPLGIIGYGRKEGHMTIDAIGTTGCKATTETLTPPEGE